MTLRQCVTLLRHPRTLWVVLRVGWLWCRITTLELVCPGLLDAYLRTLKGQLDVREMTKEVRSSRVP